PAGVADGNAKGAVGHGEEVEIVPAGLLGWAGSPGNRKAGHGGCRLGKQPLLDVPRDGELLFALVEGLLRLPALDELADLAADADHHVQQAPVRPPDLPAVELKDP